MEPLVIISVSAPGKVILHGEHSVVYGKIAIASSLGLRSFSTVKVFRNNETCEPYVNIDFVDLNFKRSIKLKSIIEKLISSDSHVSMKWKLPEHLEHEIHLSRVDKYIEQNNIIINSLDNCSLNALRGFLYLLSGMLDSSYLSNISLDVTLNSELSIGAGTGSSASFGVCLAGVFLQLIKYSRNPSGEIEDFSKDERKIISDWAFSCEKIMHGTPSGIDNAVCTYGSVVSFAKGTQPKSLEINLPIRILLVNTKVPRETKIQVEKVKQLRRRNEKVVDHIMDACHELAVNAIEVLQKLSESGKDDNTQYLYEHLAELWEMNHCLLSALNVSHPTIEEIREEAHRFNCACKLTGAGGGGYALILLPPTASRSVTIKLTEILLQKGFDVKETALGGSGVKVTYENI